MLPGGNHCVLQPERPGKLLEMVVAMLHAERLGTSVEMDVTKQRPQRLG